MTRRLVNHGDNFTRRRRGFTLVEMLVSLAVLAMALAMVGYVFTATVNATRQAAAYSEAQNVTQQFVNQIEEDLRNCDPSKSILVLVGRTQAAARTQADLDARKYWRVLVGNPSAVGSFDPELDQGADPFTNQYSDPRADILMFFTNRPTVSQAPNVNGTPATPPSFADQCVQGAKLSPIEVVYGHAALDSASYDVAQKKFTFAGTLRHIEQNAAGAPTGPAYLSKLPLTDWHLSRRATILRDPASVPPNIADTGFYPQDADRIARCEPYDAPSPANSMPGDAAWLSLPTLLDTLGPDHALITSGPQAACSPYAFPQGSAPWDIDVVRSINSLLYTCGRVESVPTLNYHHVATVVENPPPDLASNMGVHLLPGCAWFQVEFLMPEDPRNSLQYNGLLDTSGHPDLTKSQRWDAPRWTEVNADPTQGSTTYVFVPDTAANRDSVAQLKTPETEQPYGRLLDFARLDQNESLHTSLQNKVSKRVIRMWPYAIRITVRVFDRQGRLAEPIVRTIVHRFD
jgi:prepilin-type N-terminal cleavage/methylation domain-containing protein